MPEDRESSGLVRGLSIAENLALGGPAVADGDGWFDGDGARARALEAIGRLGIEPADPDVHVDRLSGGNRQKVLLARWLATPQAWRVLDGVIAVVMMALAVSLVWPR